MRASPVRGGRLAAADRTISATRRGPRRGLTHTRHPLRDTPQLQNFCRSQPGAYSPAGQLAVHAVTDKSRN